MNGRTYNSRMAIYLRLLFRMYLYLLSLYITCILPNEIEQVDAQRFMNGHGTTVIDGSIEINLGVILPESLKYPWAISRVLPAVQYAVETVILTPKLLTGTRLNIRLGDSQCSDTYGPLQAIDMYLQRTSNVFLGPACDYSIAPIARFSPHWNIPVITGKALARAFDDKNEYKLLTRIGGSYRKLGELLIDLFDGFKWNIIGLMYNDNGKRAGTDCFFIMEAVYHTLRKHYTSDFWYKSFSEGGAQEESKWQNQKISPEEMELLKPKLKKILEEASLHTRGKLIML